MKPSEIDQRYLDEITASRFPVIEDETPPLRIDIEGVGDQLAPEEVTPAPAAVQAPAAPLASADGFPSMTAYDPTVRERLAEFLQAGFESFGMERFQARRQAQSLIGGPSSNLPLQLGVADIVPFLGTGLQTEEAGRMLGDAADLAQQGDLGGAAINAAIGAVGLIPGAVGTVQAARKIGDMANVAGDKAVQAITGNPQATAMGVLEEAGQMSPLARIVPGVQPQAAPQRSNIGFYSAVEKAVLDSKQDKGTGAQFLAQITKTQGVKPEELKWTGLDEFLKGKKSVTKAEIQDYLNANRVDVREVQLGGPPEFETQGAALDYLAERMGGTRFDVLDSYRYRNPQDYIDLANEIRASATGAGTRFSRYTLPGGENYREILLTLPGGPRQTKFEVFDPSTQRAVPFETREEAVAFANQDPTRSSVVAEVDVSKPEYRSSHFDQPNILAHMRVNDRVVDGKKTLFIEEIQSDWHQKGRKKGYQQNLSQDEVKNLLANEGFDVNYNGANWVVSSKTGGPVPNKLAGGESNSQFAGNLNQVAAMVLGRRDLMPSTGSGIGPVPDAPFKTSWHELTLKRAIQEASEKGYDQIAFTTGKTQAERYDLSKQVNKIDVEAVEEVPNLYFVDVDVAGGKTLNLEVENGIVRNDEFAGKALEDVVGKEIAEKVMSVQQGKTQRLSGDDLRIGGEGMKGFYDNILPKSLEKLGKKFDAKVGKTEMDGVEVWQMDITPKMRETVTKQGQPLFQIGVGGGAAAGAATMQDNEERM